MDTKLSEKKRVCIVGGGQSGLVSLKRVLDSPLLTGTIIEQKDDIGGLWYYNGVKPSPLNINGTLPDPLKTPTMYDNLSSNGTIQLMQFLDHNYPDDVPTYAPQPTVYEYMQSYAKRFNLWPNIQLNTSVVDIRPEDPDAPLGQPGKWIVETHNLKTDTFSTELYDAVMICVGKHTYPYMSPIKGQESFQGPVFHAKYYKSAQDFKGKQVVLIGFGPSSADLTLQLAETAGKVTVCHRFPFGFSFGQVPENCRETKAVKRITANGVITEDDEVIPCDAIILCTGYGLKFPFLHESCGVTVVKEKYVPHLHNMTIFTQRPTLAILNLCYSSAEFVVVEIQARYFVSYLEGKIKIPSYEEMEAALQEEEAEKEKKGLPCTLWLQIGDFFGIESWPHFWRLAEEIGIMGEYKIGPILYRIHILIVGRLCGNLVAFKQDTVKRVNENTWEVVLAATPKSKAERIKLVLNPDNTLTETKEEVVEENID